MSSNPVIRIPNLPLGRIVDENGYPSEDEYTFRQALISQLQSLFGNEGCVVPTIDSTQLSTIQNNTNSQGQYTCQLGTILYVQDASDYTMDTVQIAVRNSNDYPASAPIFKTVTLT